MVVVVLGFQMARILSVTAGGGGGRASDWSFSWKYRCCLTYRHVGPKDGPISIVKHDVARLGSLSGYESMGFPRVCCLHNARRLSACLVLRSCFARSATLSPLKSLKLLRSSPTSPTTQAKDAVVLITWSNRQGRQSLPGPLWADLRSSFHSGPRARPPAVGFKGQLLVPPRVNRRFSFL